MSGLKASFSRKCNNYEDFFFKFANISYCNGPIKIFGGF